MFSCAVKLSIENTNSGRYISPRLQPMVTHTQTWLQEVQIARWFVLFKVLMKGIILKLQECGSLTVESSQKFTLLLEAPRTRKLFPTAGCKWQVVPQTLG